MEKTQKDDSSTTEKNTAENAADDTAENVAESSAEKTEVLFREFRREDIDALFFLSQKCFSQSARFTFADLLDILLEKDVVALVAEAQGEETSQIIGAIILRGELWKSRLIILTVMVDKDFRRQGLGARFISWAEKLGLSQKCEAMLAPLDEENSLGADFLREFGFDETEEENPFFPPERKGKMWRRNLNEPAGK